MQETMYTSVDLDSVQKAIIELAEGARVVRFMSQGKTVEYSDTDLASLKKLRNEIRQELSSVSGRKLFFRTKTSKGL